MQKGGWEWEILLISQNRLWENTAILIKFKIQIHWGVGKSVVKNKQKTTIFRELGEGNGPKDTFLESSGGGGSFEKIKNIT